MFEEKYFRNRFPGPNAKFIRNKKWYSQFFIYVAKQFNIKFDGQRKNALDVGCGYGYVVDILREKGYSANGIDISNYAVNIANTILNGKSTCLVCDPQTRIPFDTKFDIITCFSALEHMANPRLALTNFKETLKDSGILLIVTPYQDSTLSSIWNKLVYKGSDETHISVNKPDEWTRLLESCGFHNIQAKGFTHVPLIFNLIGKVLLIDFKVFNDNVLIFAQT